MTDDALREVERRVLWLATSMVHAANARPNPSGIKVGGHQASSASMVSLMTSLWFEVLRPEDRVSVKPHASPVFHAISYLLGRLDASYLPRLRELGGLQPYPSRTKDPDQPDYSTGSVGIGATAPVWGAVARRYLATHFDTPRGGRQISLLGDAELDEGAVWECIADPVVPRLGEVLWVVDLNRQSLDRVVPDIAATRLMRMFEAAGWQVLPVKYGRLLQSLFAKKGGNALRKRIDEMGNEEYQSLLRAPSETLSERLRVKKVLDDLSDDDVARALRDLGGHDLDELKAAYDAVADDRPTVMFAYTIKGWGLPIEGHPANHSALLTAAQYAELAERLGTSVEDPWAPFAEDSAAAALCRDVAARLDRAPLGDGKVPDVPTELGRPYKGEQATQAVLGRVLVDLTREAPEVAARVVTVSPDVASSTNTGGWINKVGVWAPEDRNDWFADATDILMRWKESQRGQHIELGIAETNLVGLLGELGATWMTAGEPLLPIGTVYDPFVARALEPWAFGVYGGGQSILVGTPSGVTLAAEGGAHQSVITPSIGLEQPGVTAWEPAFAQDLEWVLLHALSRLGRADGEGAYIRLTTRPVDQSLAGTLDEQRRRDVLAGAYRLRDGNDVTLVAVGAVVPDAVAAADELSGLGVDAGVVVVSSYDRLWRSVQARRGLLPETLAHGVDETVVDRVLGNGTPLVTVLDGHPHTLAFLGAATRAEVTCLGVSRFGQAGAVGDLYRLHGIDTRAVVEAALDLLDV
ncbi:MAG TPA: transketolase C-terminal domain-containing protein [Frankiaceae bacterium]|nr:transketolase C-terminal domain-containing protein [Frankiaceae bacterium]